MKQILYILTITICLASCDHTTGENKSDISQSDTIVLTDSIIPGVFDLQTGYLIQEMIVNNVIIRYCLNDKGDTAKIWTLDPKFKTSDGYKIGTAWKELPFRIKEVAYKLPGWGYYIELDDGWKLCFCEGKSCTDNPPVDSSKVVWIEKRN